MYDIHCHLDHPSLMSVLGNISKDKIRGLITSGIEYSSWTDNLKIAQKYPFNVSLGLHPFFAKDKHSEIIFLKELLKEKNVIAVGEIGLDYYNDYVGSKELQQDAFYKQMIYARELNLPVILHCRKAYDDLYAILKQIEVPALIFHSFSGTEQDVSRMQEFNSYFSFGFPIVNMNNKKHKRLVKLIPKDKLLLETDSPYMIPRDEMDKEEGFSSPSDIGLVYKAVSAVLDVSTDSLVLQTQRNVKRIWKDFRELSN